MCVTGIGSGSCPLPIFFLRVQQARKAAAAFPEQSERAADGGISTIDAFKKDVRRMFHNARHTNSNLKLNL